MIEHDYPPTEVRLRITTIEVTRWRWSCTLRPWLGDNDVYYKPQTDCVQDSYWDLCPVIVSSQSHLLWMFEPAELTNKRMCFLFWCPRRLRGQRSPLFSFSCVSVSGSTETLMCCLEMEKFYSDVSPSCSTPAWCHFLFWLNVAFWQFRRIFHQCD